MIDTDLLLSASESAQRCQRNWNPSKKIPDTIIDQLKKIVINSPTKQNDELYSVIFCSDNDIIQEIYHNSIIEPGFENLDEHKNSQILANLLIIFCTESPSSRRNKDHLDQSELSINRYMAIGIASGQLALAANLLGLKSGFCKCFDKIAVANILGKNPELLLGIGYPNENKNRREHHLIDYWFPSFNKDLTIVSMENGSRVSEKFSSGVEKYTIDIILDYSNLDEVLNDIDPLNDFLKKYSMSFDTESCREMQERYMKDFNLFPSMSVNVLTEKKIIIQTYETDSKLNCELFKTDFLNENQIILFLKQHGWVCH
jgi:nitroreductase